MALQCLFTSFGIGVPCDQGPSYTLAKNLFLTKPGFSFTDVTDFATEASWQTAIAAGNVMPLLNVQEVEPTDVEDTDFETSTGEKISLFEGNRGAIYSFNLTLDQHKILRTYEGNRFKMLFADRKGVMVGSKNSDGSVSGLSLGFFKVRKRATPSPDGGVLTAVEVQESFINEIDSNGVYFAPSWNVAGLTPPDKVVLTTGAVAANVFTASVNYVNQSKYQSDGSQITEPIDGLLVGDFEVLSAAGATITPDSVVAAGTPGDYTITCTTDTVSAGDTCQVVGSSANKYQSEVVTLA